jgi:hypothetical protein
MTKDLAQLASVVAVAQQMRKAQKLYFRTRDKEVLIESKKLEAALDKMLAILLPENDG